MGCILTFTINLRLASNRIGWVNEIGSIESIVRERLSSDIGSSPFFVYVLRDDSDKNYPHEICKANTHTEK